MKRIILFILLLLATLVLSAQTGPGWRYTPKSQSDSLVIYKYLKLVDGWIRIQNPVSAGQIIRGVQVGNRVVFMNQPYVSEGGGTVTEADPIYSASSWFSTTNNAPQWDMGYQAYLWGNHADMGYLTGTPWRDEGYIKSYTETDPNVYAWARAMVKPSYTWPEIANKPVFATVAVTGSYNDLLNKPVIPASPVNADWNATTGLARILNKPSLFDGTWASLSGKPSFATVATSGSYLDLVNRPTIPAAQIPSDWNATTGVSRILNKPTLFDGTWNSLTGKPTFATVATTGSYNDLTNKPATMSQPPAGIPVSTGSTWGASIVNNSTNWNLAVTNMGKSQIDGSSSYGKLNPDFFYNSTGVIHPITSSTPTSGSLLPVTSDGVYDALLGKMSNWNLSLDGSTVMNVGNGSTLDIVAGSGVNITYAQGHLNISATGVGTETDPTVYAWAKAAVKPTYTYSEVGAAPTLGSYSNIFRVNRLRLGQDNAWNIYGNGTTLEFNYNASTYATLTTAGLITSADYKQSDRRLKSRIRPLRSLDWVDDIHFYSYLFKPDGKYHIGVIAQEVQEQQPEMVTEGPDGMLAVNMNEVLLAKIARLEQQMEKQQREINRLKKKRHEK